MPETSDDLRKGVIVEVNDGGGVVIESDGKKIKGKDLAAGYTPQVGDPVEFVVRKGQTKEIRRAGEGFDRKARPVGSGERFKHRNRSKTRGFRNPKNFVPTPRRPKSGVLADALPAWHDHAAPGHIFGSIEVTATVATPLLILDSARTSVDGRGHKTFATRIDGEYVVIGGSALKGAIRSMFESVTNSRMVAFTERERLASRRRADGVQLMPVRIERRDGALVARLLPGTGDQTQRAAWVPAQNRNEPKGVSPLDNGKPCTAVLQKYQHSRNGRNDFQVWRAVEITMDGDQRRTFTPPPGSLSPSNGKLEVKGWIAAVGLSTHRKHDERIFFRADGKEEFLFVSDDVVKKWSRLISDYRNANERVLKTGKEFRGPHITDLDYKTLKEGSLAYAQISGSGNDRKIEALFPVQMSRILDEKSPYDLLRPELRPAEAIEQLSPAEHLFGWVAPGKAVPSAFAGCLAIDEAHLPKSCVKNERRVLGILSSPKPAQARFYLGVERSDGTPVAFADGEELANIRYDDQKIDNAAKVLRGRAFFERPRMEDIAPAARQGTDQNRSIENTIAEGTQFTFRVHLHNARPSDVGALLWILDGGRENRAISVGFGKPLGYGSITLKVSESDLLTSERLAESWFDWEDSAREGDSGLVSSLIDGFKSITASAYNCEFADAPHIQALIEGSGDPTGKLPIHYPRRARKSTEDGKNYEWFTSNEKVGRDAGPHCALPDLGDPDRGLPYFE